MFDVVGLVMPGDFSIVGDYYSNNEVDLSRYTQFRKLVLNLEAPIAIEGPRELDVGMVDGKIRLSVNADTLRRTISRFDGELVASLANNHILDLGEEGLTITRTYLEKLGVQCIGVVSGGAQRPWRTSAADGSKWAIYSYLDLQTVQEGYQDIYKRHLIATLTHETLEKDLRASSADELKIAFVHWGDEDIGFITESCRSTARNILSLGFDYVIGTHAHVIQSDKLALSEGIVGGLGNFIMEPVASGRFTKPSMRRHRRVLRVDVQGKNRVSVSQLYLSAKTYEVARIQELGRLKCNTPSRLLLIWYWILSRAERIRRKAHLASYFLAKGWLEGKLLRFDSWKRAVSNLWAIR